MANLRLFAENCRDTEAQIKDQREIDVNTGLDPLPSGHRSDSPLSETIDDMSSAAAKQREPIAADEVRQDVDGLFNRERKAQLGQFMTPDRVARYMASLFSKNDGAIRLLDAGAGLGSLTNAFINRWGDQGTTVAAYEIDPALVSHLRTTLKRLSRGNVEARIIHRDFIQDAVYQIKLGTVGPRFTHAIMNPPYKKIASGSAHRALLSAVGLETVNLYTAFVGLAIRLMAKGGEIVAIIPRSFCNGPYYKPFREWLLANSSVEQIHLFHSRTSAFRDDAVLQENVIVKLVAGKKQGSVTITTSSDSRFADLQSFSYPFTEIVHHGDDQKFIHVPVSPDHTGIEEVPLAVGSLEEIGLEVSTGPVVDFRLKEFLRDEFGTGTAPLLYPAHFSHGVIDWPRHSKKPNAIVNNPATRKLLFPSGFYTVVRRFSSKEERRRIVAHVVNPALFKSKAMGFENHLNVFHSGKAGIEKDIAHGLSAFLNSTAVDKYFRRFSGHTQVNATDLRRLRYPRLKDLKKLGIWVQAQERLTQDMIDKQLAAVHVSGRK